MKQSWPSLVPFDYTILLISLSLTNCTKWTLLTAVTWSYTKKNSNHHATTKHHQRGLQWFGRGPLTVWKKSFSRFFLLRHVTTVLRWTIESWNLAGVGAKRTSYTTISVSGYGLMPHLSLQFYWLDALECSCWTCGLHLFSDTKMMTSGRSLDLAALSRPLQSSYTPSHSSQRGPSIPDDGNGHSCPSAPLRVSITSKLPLSPRWQWPRKWH